jgi:hypothetical protein
MERCETDVVDVLTIKGNVLAALDVLLTKRLRNMHKNQQWIVSEIM